MTPTKYKVYLTNGTDSIIYNLEERYSVGYLGYTDKQLKKRILISPKEMHVYEEIR